MFRPDGHVLARCRGVAGEFARQAINSVLSYKKSRSEQMQPPPASIHDRDRLYDEFSACFDASAGKDRERALARLVVALANRLPLPEALEAIGMSKAIPGKKKP